MIPSSTREKLKVSEAKSGLDAHGYDDCIDCASILYYIYTVLCHNPIFLRLGRTDMLIPVA